MTGTGRRYWVSAVAVSLAYGALLVFLRGSPRIGGDSGIFLSVAARLLRGDRLYADVFDNKDPLFFYADAAALAVGGWRAPFMLDALWLAVSAISIAGLLRAVGMAKPIAVISFIVYPVLLTGTWYLTGQSMLAALALAPLIGWLWAIGRWRPAGAALCVALLFKISLVLVLVAAPLALLVLRRRGPVREPLVKSATAFGAALSVAAVFLAVRGELVPYLSMLRQNVSYANDVLVHTGRESGVEGHVRTAAQVTPHFWLVVVVFAFAGLLACWKLAKLRSGSASATPETVLAGLFLVVSGAVTVTLALTAAWDHHMQMLAYPGTLLVAFLVSSAIAAEWPPVPRLVAACACLAVGVVLLGGRVNPGADTARPLSRWWWEPYSYTAEALESARTDQLAASGTVSYAHLGANDEDGHAAFLDGSFELACPMFHQYVWTPDLDAVLRCIEGRKPELVVVTPSFRYEHEASAPWNEWLASGQALLEHEYAPAYQLDGPLGAYEVWLRRS